jgi:hypothetical protein
VATFEGLLLALLSLADAVVEASFLSLGGWRNFLWRCEIFLLLSSESGVFTMMNMELEADSTRNTHLDLGIDRDFLVALVSRSTVFNHHPQEKLGVAMLGSTSRTVGT